MEDVGFALIGWGVAWLATFAHDGIRSFNARVRVRVGRERRTASVR